MLSSHEGGEDSLQGRLLLKLKTTPPLPGDVYHVYLFCSLAGLANALSGYEMSIISAAKIAVSSDFGIPSTSVSYAVLASGMAIGATAGAASAGYLQSSIGRRFSLVLACCIYIAAGAVSFGSSSFAMLAWGRIQTGVAVGLITSTAPLYIAELSPAHVRGSLVSINQACCVAGVLLGFVAGKLLSPHWRIMFAAAAPAAGLLLAAFLFITPFSPRWLAAKGRMEEARRVLRRLRGCGDDASEIDGQSQQSRDDAASELFSPPEDEDSRERAVEEELEGIRAALLESNSFSAWEILRQPWVSKAVRIGVALGFIQQWCGVNAANAYAPDILKAAGFSAADALTQSIYVGVVKLATILVGLAVMDRFGRRQMLLAGTAGMTLSLLGMAACLTIPSAPPLLSAACLCAFLGAFEIGLGPVVWLLLSELYPLRVRGPAMAIGSTALWLFTVSVTFSYPVLAGSIGVNGSFFLYAAVCVAAMVWIYLYLPETRGKSLEDIEKMLREGRTT